MGWTQTDLSNCCSPPIAISTISAIENGGDVSVSTLDRIATALGIPLWRFFLDSEKAPPVFTDAHIERIVDEVTAGIAAHFRSMLRLILQGMTKAPEQTRGHSEGSQQDQP